MNEIVYKLLIVNHKTKQLNNLNTGKLIWHLKK